ncbi:hypothetical protein DHD80_11930 [Gramella sp. AN32]|nr:hypothetical protein [Gramella sp. AN32]
MLIALYFGCKGNFRAQKEIGTTYYIDNWKGDDLNSGISTENAWKSLDKVNSMTFEPGDNILFKANGVWNGQLLLDDSGTEGAPIVVSSYGKGNKPIINGGGSIRNNAAAIRLKNTSFLELNNLEITNTNGANNYQGDLWAILSIADNGAEIKHVYLSNCYIHDVNGKVATKTTGGIYVIADGEKPAFYNDLQIRDNTIENIGGLGIATNSPHANIDAEKRYPFLNVLIKGNFVKNTGRNNVIIRVSDDAVVEHNTLVNSSRYDNGHSIFNFNTVNCKIQYNEAYGNSGPPGDIDRGGFDADYNSKDTKIQYNYSHDNDWGFAIMKKAINENVVIRYNISENDQYAIYFYGFNNQKGMGRAKIYNNTHYIRKGINVEVFKERTAYNTDFYNNIFYFEGSDNGSWGTASPVDCSFENNGFYNIEPKGTNYLTSDPKFKNPGAGGQDIDWEKYPNVLLGYQLNENSPYINKGRDLQNNGGKDFWGNSLNKNTTDIGAHEF